MIKTKKPQKKTKPKNDKCTPKEAAFAKEYVETGNGVQSALKVYDTQSYKSASVIADQNLEKLRIQKLIASYAPKAALRIEELSEQDENLNVALGASKDILDRSGLKPREEGNTVNILVYNNEQARTIATRALRVREITSEG